MKEGKRGFVLISSSPGMTYKLVSVKFQSEIIKVCLLSPLNLRALSEYYKVFLFINWSYCRVAIKVFVQWTISSKILTRPGTFQFMLQCPVAWIINYGLRPGCVYKQAVLIVWPRVTVTGQSYQQVTLLIID